MKFIKPILTLAAVWFVFGAVDLLQDRSQAFAADKTAIEVRNEAGTRTKVGHTGAGAWTTPLPVLDIGQYASVVTQQACTGTVSGITVVDGDYYYLLAVTAVTLDFIATGSFVAADGFVLPTGTTMKIVASGTTLSCTEFATATTGWISVIALN